MQIANSEETIQEAAEMMATLEAGILPVGEGGRLVGMITDRDIAFAGSQKEKDPTPRSRDIMTSDVKYCFDSQDVEEITQNMATFRYGACPSSITTRSW